ncbi:MAG: phosphoglycerate dehydrogenase [Euryarchaeota archaeon]|nr:phosphoglycerate dehydrogenase [Euryarchaeota archaeon]
MKILITDGIAEEGAAALRKEHEVVEKDLSPQELPAEIGKYDALIVRSRSKVTAEVIEKGANLKVIGRAGIGVDNIDVAAATRKGIMVVNAPQGSTVSVAELALGLMLSLARGLPRADLTMHVGKWEKKGFMGTELCGKTLGFIGAGRIGGEVAKRAQAFGMRTVAYDPYLPKEAAENMGIKLVNLDTVLKDSDYITIHAMLTPETKGMVNAMAIEKMKRTVFIVNCARGGIIDEKALCEALKSKRIAGAALDVYESEPPANSPLLTLDNIILTPHIGASTHEGQERAGVMVAEQVLKALRGERPDAVVNKEVLK